MIGEHQQIRLAVGRERALYRRFQRGDIGRMFGVVADKVDIRQGARGFEGAVEPIPDRRHRGAGELRVERQHDQARDALRHQAVHRALQAGVAVAHSQRHRHIDARRQRLALLLAIDHQRRAPLHPDGGVELRHARRAKRQNDAIEDRPPEPARRIDDAGIAEKLFQIALYSGSCGGVWRTEINQ